MMKHGLGQIASFAFEHPERGWVLMEVEILWTWWVLCYVQVRRIQFDDAGTIEWYDGQKYRFFKFWWNLGYYPLEER